jgi:hypothetical protein
VQILLATQCAPPPTIAVQGELLEQLPQLQPEAVPQVLLAEAHACAQVGPLQEYPPKMPATQVWLGAQAGLQLAKVFWEKKETKTSRKAMENRTDKSFFIK